MQKTIITLFTFFSLSLSVPAQTWAPLGNNNAGPGHEVSSLTVFNGELIASAGQVVRWDAASNSWVPLGGGLFSLPNESVNALKPFNGELYAAGEFNKGNGRRSIAKWDGSNWLPLGYGLKNNSDDGYVNALEVFNGALYAAGGITASLAIPMDNVAKWDGTGWSALPDLPQSSGNSYIYCLKAHQGKLYAGNAHQVLRYDDTVWTVVGNMNGVVADLESYNGHLYASGCFDLADSVQANHIARWDGTSWSALSEGFTQSTVLASPIVWAMEEFQGYLYAGGSFIDAGGHPASNIARWDGSSWAPLGAGVNIWVKTLTSLQDTLYVAGQFDTAGGLQIGDIARLIPCTSPAVMPGAVSGPIAPCAASPAKYSVPLNPSECYSYTWTIPPGWTGISSGNGITLTPDNNPGTLSVVASNACGGSASQSLQVTPIPVTQPVITKYGNTISTNAQLASYQWYSFGVPIQGAVSASYIPVVDGIFHLEGIDLNGCPVRSDSVIFLLDVAELDKERTRLFPNPNSGAFTLEGELPARNGALNYVVRDLSGRIVQTGIAAERPGTFRKEFILKNAAPGMYVLTLGSGTSRTNYPFVVK